MRQGIRLEVRVPRSQPEARQLSRCEAIDAVGLRLEADQSS